MPGRGVGPVRVPTPAGFSSLAPGDPSIPSARSPRRWGPTPLAEADARGAGRLGFGLGPDRAVEAASGVSNAQGTG